MLRSMLVADLLGLLGMFVILLPLSKRMVRSYARNIEMQKQFITNAGHEIKTPVAIIMSDGCHRPERWMVSSSISASSGATASELVRRW